VLAWPASTFGYQPALRVAVGDSQHRHELQVDSGLFLIDEAGSTLSLIAAAAGYQHTFAASWRNAPFAAARIGLFHEGGERRASTVRSYGAGVGLRHLVREGHGALRAELHVDHLVSDSEIGRPALTTLGLRLGFDLWL